MNLFPLTHSFTYLYCFETFALDFFLLIYLYCSGCINFHNSVFYNLLFLVIHLFIWSCSNCPQIGTWELTKPGACVLFSHAFSSLTASLLSGCVTQFHLLSFPQTWNWPFLKEPWKVFRNQDLYTRNALCSAVHKFTLIVQVQITYIFFFLDFVFIN